MEIEKETFVERRKWPRISLDDRLLCFRFYNDSGQLKTQDLPLYIGIRDISYGGIGGMCNRKCEEADHMFINLVIGEEKCEFELAVAWCKIKGAYNDVGFMFVHLTESKVMFLDRYINRLKKSKERSRKRKESINKSIEYAKINEAEASKRLEEKKEDEPIKEDSQIKEAQDLINDFERRD